MKWLTCVGVGILAATAAAGIGWAAQGGAALYIKGHLASSDVRMIDGKAYVPVDDIGRAMELRVVRKGTGYALVPAGGGNAVAGRAEGRLNEELFTGQWKFQVKSVRETPSYTQHFSPDGQNITPHQAGDVLVVLDCRIKNAHPTKEVVPFATEFDCSGNTALADASGQSFQPYSYDVHYDAKTPLRKELLPGAAVDFALIFSVPSGTKPKDLVYTLLRYDDRGNHRRYTDVRVNLK